MTARMFLKPLVLCALVPPLVFSFLYQDLLGSIGHNPILSVALSGAFVIHFWRRPSFAESMTTIAIAVLFRSAYARFVGIDVYFGAAVLHWGSFLGIASIMVLGWRVLCARDSERKELLSDFIAAGAFLYYWIVLGVALTSTNILISRTYDQYLFAFDGSLGFQPSVVLARLIRNHPIALGLIQSVYFGIALPVAMLWATQRRRGYSDGYTIFPLLVLASSGGYLLYYVLPASGPIYEFSGKFPFQVPVHMLPANPHIGDILPMSHRAVRNAMPSLHLGTALIVCWNGRIWPKTVRAGLWLFFFITAFATMALGQHYFVDLVVAFPAMLIFHAGAMTSVPFRMPERRGCIGAGLAGTYAWLALLRFGSPLYLSLPVLSWSLVLGTIGGVCYLESRLARTARRLKQDRGWPASDDAAQAEAQAVTGFVA